MKQDLFQEDFAGIKNNIDIDGISLTPILNRQSEIDREDVFWHFPHYHGSLWKPGSAIRSGDWKLVFHYESNNAELFFFSIKGTLSPQTIFWYVKELCSLIT